MAYFLAGVANAEIFKGSNLFATAKTLIDSSISIGVSAEDIRAGQGAGLVGKYFHSSTFGLKLSDAMFRLEYIAANVGAEITLGGDVFVDEELTASVGGVLTLGRTCVPMKTGGAKFAYIKLASDRTGTYETKTVGVGVNTVTGVTASAVYCVKYLYTNSAARKIEVSANFIPGTLSVYLTASLFSGDASNVSSGTKVGTVTIKIERFILSGTNEIAMSMTGSSKTSFEGSALAAGGAGCEGGAIYAEIIEVIDGARWFTDAKGLIIEDSNINVTVAEAATLIGTAPTVYAFYTAGSPKLINNTLLTAQESYLAAGNKSKLVYSIIANATGLSINATTGEITGAPAEGTATIKVKGQVGSSTDIAKMDAGMVIIISANP